MLEVRAIHKRFAPDKEVLQGVSLTVEPQEILCLLGPSGCGKSTLLRIIAGLERADQGQVLLHGSDITETPTHRRSVGLMFQDYALFPHLNVAENIAYGLRMQGVSVAERRRRVEEMLALVNLEGYANRSVDDLSGGEQQRVALARTLAPNPTLLLLDEPVANLDRLLREELLEALRRILKHLQVTTIFVTHDQEEAFALADRIAVMRAGRLEQVDAPAALYRRPANTFVAAFLGFRNLLPILEWRDAYTVCTPIGAFSLPVPSAARSATGFRLLIPPDAAVLDSAPSSATYVPLVGRVIDATFRGSVFRLQVALKENEKDDNVLYFEFRTRGREVLPAQGEPVQLWLDVAQLCVVQEG
ncbi:MAG: ABC transporter ATP-binding protein [Caldilinea sp.]|nr:ABC transporter ATP-binding protein [Caldilinea sp.]MDW8440677.1 ABC transporter ATP-binding protein [Caldilineaceae bacterium]